MMPAYQELKATAKKRKMNGNAEVNGFQSKMVKPIIATAAMTAEL